MYILLQHFMKQLLLPFLLGGKFGTETPGATSSVFIMAPGAVSTFVSVCSFLHILNGKV